MDLIHLLQFEIVSHGGAHPRMQERAGWEVMSVGTNFCADDTDHEAVVVPAVQIGFPFEVASALDIPSSTVFPCSP